MLVILNANIGDVSYLLTRLYKLLYLGMVAYLPKKEKRRKNLSGQLQQSKIWRKEKKINQLVILQKSYKIKSLLKPEEIVLFSLFWECDPFQLFCHARSQNKYNNQKYEDGEIVEKK